MAAPYSLEGDSARRKFVKEYSVRCLFYSILFPGQRERCCCGKPLEGKYYLFRHGDGKEAYFFAGPGCGSKLIYEARAAGKDLIVPNFFSPFVQDAKCQNNESPTPSSEHGTRADRNDENLEMINSASLLLYLWNSNTEGPLFRIRQELLMSPKRIPTDRELQTLNNAIANSYNKPSGARTLREWHQIECQRNNSRARAFHFPKLERRFHGLNIVSLL